MLEDYLRINVDLLCFFVEMNMKLSSVL